MNDTSEEESRDDKDRSPIESVLEQGSIAGVAKVLKKGLGFLFQVLLGNFLGTSAYGIFTFGSSVVTVIGQLSTLGLKNGLIKFISTYNDNRHNLKGTLIVAFGSALVVSTATSSVLYISAEIIATEYLNNGDLTITLQLFSVCIPFTVLLGLIKSSVQGRQNIREYAIVDVFISSARIVFAVGLAWLGFDLQIVILGYLFSLILSLLLGLYYLSTDVLIQLEGISPNYELRRLLRFSLPLYIAGLSFMLMTRVDIFAIQYFTDSADVGSYQAAVVLATVANLPLIAFNKAFSPMISSFYNQSRMNELEDVFQSGTRWVTAVALLFGLLLMLFRRELLLFWGPAYTVAETSLVFLAAGQIVNVATGPVGYLLQMVDHQDYVLFNNISTVILNIILNIALVPRFGILGAGLATGLSLTANNFLGLIEIRVLLDIRPWNLASVRLLPPVVFSSGFYLVLARFRVPWAIEAIITSFVFISILIIVLPDEDWGTLRSMGSNRL